MNELLSKISSYHLFNYLLPGCLFAVVGTQFTGYQFIQQNVILGLFLYYFYGLVISRLGSLILEPALKATHFLKFADYSEFITACKEDAKIDVLSETNNMYRTLCTLLVTLVLAWVGSLVERKFIWIRPWNLPLAVVLLLVLFLLSYRKQTNYITKRVKASLPKRSKEEEENV